MDAGHLVIVLDHDMSGFSASLARLPRGVFREVTVLRDPTVPGDIVSRVSSILEYMGLRNLSIVETRNIRDYVLSLIGDDRYIINYSLSSPDTISSSLLYLLRKGVRKGSLMLMGRSVLTPGLIRYVIDVRSKCLSLYKNICAGFNMPSDLKSLAGSRAGLYRCVSRLRDLGLIMPSRGRYLLTSTGGILCSIV